MVVSPLSVPTRCVAARRWEDDRVIVRCRLHRVFILTCLLPCVSGCSDRFLAGPLRYEESDALTKDLKGKTNLAGKTRLQDKVRNGLANLFGENPKKIKVPDGMGVLLTGGGARLANYQLVGEGANAKIKRNVSADKHQIAGGFGLYRRHCLHCHGVSGAGDGPTAAFLYPIPRDYRKGLFKFTSTPNGARPHRDDLRRTVTNGLHGTSMPAFEALLSADEIQQVVDYVIFLSIRGETELSLIDEGAISDENDPEALSAEITRGVAESLFNKWKTAQTQVVNPPVPRTLSSQDSIIRGRELFLGRTKEKLECAGCHGSQGVGDGPSFVSQDVFNQVVFGGNPSEREDRIKALDDKTRELWGQKLDEWGNPLRPANLKRGVYKGGRRPLDIYWRIAKGITGAQMPAHYPTIDHKQIWDLVNFVLALPYQPDLLKGAPPAAPLRTAAVANR
jgi:mono/diheme cytochrome c family protein